MTLGNPFKCACRCGCDQQIASPGDRLCAQCTRELKAHGPS